MRVGRGHPNVVVRMPVEMRQLLEADAKKNERTLSQEIRLVLNDYLARLADPDPWRFKESTVERTINVSTTDPLGGANE